MDVKVHIEQHSDLLMGGTLAIVGITCLVVSARGINRRMNKMKSDIIDAIKKSK